MSSYDGKLIESAVRLVAQAAEAAFPAQKKASMRRAYKQASIGRKRRLEQKALAEEDASGAFWVESLCAERSRTGPDLWGFPGHGKQVAGHRKTSGKLVLLQCLLQDYSFCCLCRPADMHGLPLDVLQHVFRFLDAPSLVRASAVCKAWRETALSHGEAWERLFRRALPMARRSAAADGLTAESWYQAFCLLAKSEQGSSTPRAPAAHEVVHHRGV